MENVILYSTILMILTFVIMIGCASYFIYRIMKKNIVLTEQLRQIEIKKDEFSAMVTHELKTPLFPIIGYCKMFKTSMFGKLNDEQGSAIDAIEKNAKVLENLINDIMDARKLDIGKMKFKFEDLDMAGFFEGVSASYKKILHEKGIEFVTNRDLKGVIVNADSSRLQQVFDNLIGNAIKFVPQKGARIEIGGYKEDGNVIMYIKDNGIGIPQEKQKDLFKKFYQIDTSERRHAGGTGLGLAISKGIIERMNGSIWVQSDGKTGTTFYLKLPQK
jgi:signal transduction histidine kinase